MAKDKSEVIIYVYCGELGLYASSTITYVHRSTAFDHHVVNNNCSNGNKCHRLHYTDVRWNETNLNSLEEHTKHALDEFADLFMNHTKSLALVVT